MKLLALAAAVSGTSANEFIADSLLRVQVLAERELPAERAIGPNRPFYSQEITRDGYLEFIDRNEEKAARRKYDMDMSDLFYLTEWIGVSSLDGSLQHRGWLYCVRRSRLGTEKCFQDADSDGKFDHLTTLDPDIPTRFLIFLPIEPIVYRYVPRKREPIGAGSVRQPELSLVYKFVDGQLQFEAYAYTGLASTVHFGKLATVNPQALPATIELAGALVRVVSWDGKRAKLSVQRPMSTSAIRFVAPDNRPLVFGSRRGWRLEFVNSRLPGR